MYDKLSGMTGTAETEETEFYSIYGLEVSVIPTNRPIRRADQADRIYKTRKEKHDAIMEEVERLHHLGWPVLIGTVNVDVSETLSRQLKRRGLKHEVLNAKYHQREAEIVAGAGQKGAIVIATNMAGRGTDIKLGKDLDLTQEEAGLQIVGTERHESRRIDRQLRGRSGRQGDPGQSIFFLSLEDDLMRLFGSDRIARWMDKSGAEEGEVITGGLVTRAIEQAQKRVELQNFQQRKRLLEYDDVMNQQREVIYSLRLFALERGEELKAEARRMIESALDRAVTQFLADTERPEEYDRGGLRESLTLQYLITVDALIDAEATPTIERMAEVTKQEGEQAFQRKLDYLADFGRTIAVPEVETQVLSQVMLTVLDERWKDHLYDLDQLRNAIQYRAWGQKDPLIEYKREAFDMFDRPDARHPVDLHRALPQDPGGRGAAAPGAAGSSSAAAGTDSGSRGLDGGGRSLQRPRPQGGSPALPRARVEQLARSSGPRHRRGAGGGAERSLSVRLGQEVQEVPRGGEVMAGSW